MGHLNIPPLPNIHCTGARPTSRPLFSVIGARPVNELLGAKPNIMLIPSTKLKLAMQEVAAGLFFESVNYSKKVDLAVKMPTEVIKFLYFGVKSYFSVRLIPTRKGLALYTSIAVEDDPDAMFYLIRSHHPNDTKLISRFLFQDEIELHAFDELDRNIASFKGKALFASGNAKSFVKLKPLIAKLTAQEIAAISDYLQREFVTDTSGLRMIELNLFKQETPSFWHVSELANPPSTDPDRFTLPYNILDQDQGKQFEINLTRVFGRLYDAGDIFPSPWGVTPTTTDREFIDLVIISRSRNS
jgi:hypothetical protein